MELRDRVVVVTGGASGIGAAICGRFAREGPRVLVVADRDGAGAERVAARLRDEHPAVPAEAAILDVGDADAVADLVGDVTSRHGVIDLFCANAGVATGAGMDAPPPVWDDAWAVNVMAHVHALRALLPAWLERGDGYLLSTASAAGLLTNLGDAPYSVTKHAAVALAEWVAITYGDRGVRVSCLCPQGVRTPMLFGGGNRPAPEGLAARVVTEQRVLEPDAVADVVVEGLRDERFLILPHPEVADYERARAADRDRWLGAMRRLQARLGST
jgi:NAD(P)-dependent dehydrogenase (short-subunit alcohol dehydrogenase family)